MTERERTWVRVLTDSSCIEILKRSLNVERIVIVMPPERRKPK